MPGEPAPGQPGTEAANTLLLTRLQDQAALGGTLSPAQAQDLMDTVGASAALGAKCGQATTGEAGAMIGRASRLTERRTAGTTAANLEYRGREKLLDPTLLWVRGGAVGCVNAGAIWAVLALAFGPTVAEAPAPARSALPVATPVLPSQPVQDEELRNYLAKFERQGLQRAAERLAEHRKEEAVREPQRKRDAAALSLALADGRIFGRALSCYLITRGDIRYTEDLAVRHTMQAAPNSSDSYSISRSFREGVTAGERETAGPSDYGCQDYNAQARARVVAYGGSLR